MISSCLDNQAGLKNLASVAGINSAPNFGAEVAQQRHRASTTDLSHDHAKAFALFQITLDTSSSSSSPVQPLHALCLPSGPRHLGDGTGRPGLTTSSGAPRKRDAIFWFHEIPRKAYRARRGDLLIHEDDGGAERRTVYANILYTLLSSVTLIHSFS